MSSRGLRIILVMSVVASAILMAGAAFAAGGAAPAPAAVTVKPLSAQEAADLQFVREEEKLARDVYDVLFEKWGVLEFSNIAASEQTHTDSVKNLIVKYGITDPAASTTPGVFQDSHLQDLYDMLIAKGLTSSADAIEVGIIIEETDIEDLTVAMGHTAKTDILRVYSNLRNGSYNHLAAFQALAQ